MPKKPQPKKTSKKKATKAMLQVIDDAIDEIVPTDPKPAPEVEDVEDGDCYEPYAPKEGEVPLAAGETQETAPQPGGWSEIIREEKEEKPADEGQKQPSRQEATESPETPLSPVAPLFGSVTADELSKALRLAVNAIEWLTKCDRRLPLKDKAILASRTNKLRSLLSQIP